MREQFPSHIPFYFRAHVMPFVGIKNGETDKVMNDLLTALNQFSKTI